MEPGEGPCCYAFSLYCTRFGYYWLVLSNFCCYLKAVTGLFLKISLNALIIALLLCFFSLLYSILLLLISFFKFLLYLKAVTGSFLKISLNALSIDKVFQCLRTTSLILVRDRLYVNTSRIFVSFEVVLPLSFKISFLSIFSTAFICLFISFGL